jgi:hypothetical protein
MCSAGGISFDAFTIPQLGRQFKLDVSDMTVKTILNKVVKESPLAKIWVIKKYSVDRTFVIWLNAHHEDYQQMRKLDWRIPG